MKLYLVQHAEAKSESEDPNRSLSKKGYSDIRKVANFIAMNKNITVSSIMHSGKTRAQQTAEVLAGTLKPDEGVQQINGLSPLDEPSIWANRLAEMTKDVILVGHLPHLSKLASYLVCQDTDKKITDFQMGGIVCLKKDDLDNWSIGWMVIPEMLV